MGRAINAINFFVRFQLGAEAGLNLQRAGEIMRNYYLPLAGMTGNNSRTSIGFYQPPDQTSPANSGHYYNGLDPNTVAANLGGQEGDDHLARALTEAGILRLADVVPNHVHVEYEQLCAWAQGREPSQPSANVLWNHPHRERIFDLHMNGREPAWRCFFDVQDLVGVRIHDPAVFKLVLERALHDVKQERVSGWRVDHPDGMKNPNQFFRLLGEAGVELVYAEAVTLGHRVPNEWRVAGDVGYNWLNMSRLMHTDPAAERAWRQLYNEAAQDFTTGSLPLSSQDEAQHAKLEMVQGRNGRPAKMATEVRRLQQILGEPELDRHIGPALAGLRNHYRTYVEPHRGYVPDTCRKVIEESNMHPGLRRILLLEAATDEAQHARHAEFVACFQQYTGPCYAMGVENTAIYRDVCCLRNNEVGNIPGRNHVTIQEVHTYNMQNQQRYPRQALPIATHDCKLGWYTAALIGALPTFADQWAKLYKHWKSRYVGRLEDVIREGNGAGRTLWQIMQVLTGARVWDPDYRVSLLRVQDYQIKSMREAKLETNWDPEYTNHGWEKAVLRLVRDLYSDQRFLQEFAELAPRVDNLAQRNARRQWLYTLTCPGIPFLYQGDEVWDPVFVDPDNRRRQNWGVRREMLAGVLAGDAVTFGGPLSNDRMVMLHRLSRIREQFAEDFGPEGAYHQLDEGDFSFARGCAKRVIVCGGKKLQLPGYHDILPEFPDISCCVRGAA